MTILPGTIAKSRKAIDAFAGKAPSVGNPYLDVAKVRAAARAGKLEDLFVMNVAEHKMIDPVEKREVKRRMALMLAFKRSDEDEPVNITIPITFIPFNLADHGPVDAIVNSNQFANFVNKGKLAIVKPEVARALFDSEPSWRIELEKINNFGAIVTTASELSKEPEASAFVRRVIAEKGNVQSKIETLSSSIEQVSNLDLRWIMKHADEDKLKQFAHDVLEEREGEEE